MERRTSILRNANLRRVGVGVLVTSGLMGASTENVAQATVAPEVKRTPGKPSPEWEVQWKETFDDPTLSDRWKTMDNTSYPWETFADYRAIGAKVLRGNLEIIARAHCVAPGEDMTMANAQEGPCGQGTERRISTGRVEQAIPDIEGDFRIDIVAKMQVPKIEGQVAQFSWWTTNIDETPGSGNEGFCDVNSATATEEIDIAELHGDGIVRVNHHAYCKNGDLPDIPRSKKLTAKELSKFHTYTVEHIRNKTRFLFDGVAIKLRKKYGNRSADKRSDFTGVTNDEFRAIDQYPHHLIFDVTAFKDPFAESPAFRAPDPNLPYPTQKARITEVTVSTATR